MFRHYLTNDFLDPTGVYYDPIPENATKEDLEEYQALSAKMLVRSIVAFVIVITILGIVGLFSSCSPTKEISSIDQHIVSTMMERMDSVLSTRTVVQQDSAWRETILKQFQSIREKSDTSHYVVADTAGNIIREKIVINNTREVTSETDRQEIQYLSHRLEVIDSTMNLMRQQLSHSDSLLQSRQETTIKEVEKPLSWWQQSQIWLGRLVLIALAVLAAIWILKRKFPWLPFGK